jgi:NAD(P)-dependent dehydrogenase (short-subunit alcohol dehydrogenase family)
MDFVFKCSNNAGIISAKFQVTEDGFEKVFATNYLGRSIILNMG